MSFDPSYLIEFIEKPATRIAVLLPCLIALLFWWGAATKGVVFAKVWQLLLGIAITMICSHWKETDDGLLSFHMLPGYALVAVLLPAAERPSSRLGYAFTFLSLLITDVAAAAVYTLQTSGQLTSNFYLGVGGAGHLDALFLLPLATAITLKLLAIAERCPQAHEPILKAGRRLTTREVKAQVPTCKHERGPS